MAAIVKAAPRRFRPGTELSSPRIVPRRTNALSHEPRSITTSFDDDGPGNQSPLGPRHDNDHVFIQDIQVLPTTDEILSPDCPYMPRKNLSEPHFLVNGPLRHFDTLFRHLRYDSTEAIRDMCYHAAQSLTTNEYNPDASFELRRETAAGNRYFEYGGIRLEEINAEERKGLIIRLSYNCPEFMRGRLIHNCGRLVEGMLCALICLDEAYELSVIFMEIHQRQSTTSMDNLGGLGRKAAVELSFLPNAAYDDILKITRLAHHLTSPRLVLVEFPRLLYAGFYWTLRRLQQMRPCDVAFLKYVAPSLNGSALMAKTAATKAGARTTTQCEPPLYAQASGFAYELDPISSTPMTFGASQIQSDPESFMALLNQRTTLDDGQALALRQNLTREFAFTQGPPGTGKTFLGIALARILLASRTGRPDKPILVVCMTNHALDSFLSGLRDAGIENIVRIGSGSKEEWTKAINLRELSRNSRLSQDQLDHRKRSSRYTQDLWSDLDAWCKCLNAENSTNLVSWHAIKEYLKEAKPQIHRQFINAAYSKQTESFTFDYWALGGDLKNLEDLRIELSMRLQDAAMKRSPYPESMPNVDSELANLINQAWSRSNAAGGDSLWRFSLEERKTLLETWRQMVNREKLASNFAVKHLEHCQASNSARSHRDEVDVGTLLRANVIGMTTTASATRWELLKMLDLEILICEEAGEVLEAHSLCSLLPTLEHAIFIGDPLQLRPEVAEQTMSLETATGHSYRLDESLFERFMLPRDPASSSMPTSQLNVQRRMHPDIAAITRLTYPNLLDYKTTASHPPVSGITERMFWLDHQIPEADPTNESKSHVNDYEVAMVAGIVRYLLTRNTYSMGDIAVLTPYNGQLAALVEALQTSCAVWLNPRDREALLDSGILPEESLERKGRKQSVNMSELLRVATVDNFQGEEAKVVVLSTVRSGGRPGFLKIANRINVACSRARDGFYVIGNFQTLRQVPFWQQIADVFARAGNIGTALKIGCEQHPHLHFDIRNPSDFQQIQDCQAPCGARLPCSHSCFELCHDPAAHERIPCRKPCTRTLGCRHRCQRMCFEECGICQYRVGDQVLACGHPVEALCSGVTPKCTVIVRHAKLACGHILNVYCFEKDENPVCEQECGQILPCDRHSCTGACKDCSIQFVHPPCSRYCEKQLPCGVHKCNAQCHGDTACPPCNQRCQKSCAHGRCRLACQKICDPCVKPYIGSEAPVDPAARIICSLGKIVNRSEEFDSVFDRLIAKMGRKLDMFANLVVRHERDLQQNLDLFIRNTRANPMAADRNKTRLMDRYTEVQALIRDLADLRDNFVDPIERSLLEYRRYAPGIAKYALLFHLRFVILEFRARFVRVLDLLRVAQLLAKLNDPSSEVHRQADSLEAAAVLECQNSIVYCISALVRCTAASPCVLVELLLHHAQFIVMAQIPGIQTAISPALIPKLLDRATLLCRQYPSTAGAFLDNVGSFRNYTNTGNPANVPTVTNAKSRNVERDWGRHVVGHLVTCAASHPYSSETFPTGCPECGTKMELDDEAYGRTREFLKEDDFLAAMRSK